ncbi:MAG: hypothetical protein QW303_08095 [Nitrososphaerota archaeon]
MSLMNEGSVTGGFFGLRHDGVASSALLPNVVQVIGSDNTSWYALNGVEFQLDAIQGVPLTVNVENFLNIVLKPLGFIASNISPISENLIEVDFSNSVAPGKGFKLSFSFHNGLVPHASEYNPITYEPLTNPLDSVVTSDELSSDDFDDDILIMKVTDIKSSQAAASILRILIAIIHSGGYSIYTMANNWFNVYQDYLLDASEPSDMATPKLGLAIGYPKIVDEEKSLSSALSVTGEVALESGLMKVYPGDIILRFNKVPATIPTTIEEFGDRSSKFFGEPSETSPNDPYGVYNFKNFYISSLNHTYFAATGTPIPYGNTKDSIVQVVNNLDHDFVVVIAAGGYRPIGSTPGRTYPNPNLQLERQMVAHRLLNAINSTKLYNADLFLLKVLKNFVA